MRQRKPRRARAAATGSSGRARPKGKHPCADAPTAKRSRRHTVFLSHAGVDSVAARKLARQLSDAGLKVWIDKEDLHAGDRWMQEIEKGLDESDAFAVYVGGSGVHNWVDREIRVALERNTTDPTYRVIPILAPGAAGPETLPAFLRQHQCVDFRREQSADRLKALIGAVLDGPPERISVLPPGVEPFRGLAYFDVEHSYLYFGRDSAVEELLTRLQTKSFLAVVGASGSGKSSLVRAGLVPALHRGRFPTDGPEVQWHVAVCRPGDDPFHQLGAALADLMAPFADAADRVHAVSEFRRQLENGYEGLESCIGAVPSGHRTLLVIDQFEELFDPGVSTETRRSFVDALLKVARLEGERPVHVVITLRADFYSRCWDYPDLLERVKDQYILALPGHPELRESMEKPAALAGASFEPGLVDTILTDIGDEPGALPLLEHALLQLWRKGGERKLLTHDAYHEMGGVDGALAHHADEVLSRLDPTEQDVAQKLFLRLTHPGDRTEDTRQRADRDVVATLGVDRPVAERVLEALADEGLVIVGETVEVAHDALIQKWEPLRGWIEANREWMRVRYRLDETAREWFELQNDPGALLRGARLAEAEEWAQSRGAELDPAVRELLEASVAERDREAREQEARRQQELESARRLALEAEGRAVAERQAARRSRMLAGSMTVASVVIGSLAVYANRQANEAESRLWTAESEVIWRRDPTEALSRAFRAASRARTLETERALRLSLSAITTTLVLRDTATEPARIVSAAFSPDGDRIVTTAADGAARIWDAESGQRLLILPVPGVRSAAFSPEGARLVTTDDHGAARIWQLGGDASTPLALTGHRGSVNAASFSPDGLRVVTAAADSTARVFNARTGDSLFVLSGHGGGVLAAEFSADGRRIVTAGDSTARIWDAETGRQLHVLEGHRGLINGASFSRHGERIVSAGADQTARVWDAATGVALFVLPVGHPVRSAAYSPDGTRIVTASSDATARIWNGTEPSERWLDELRGHESELFGASFSGDGGRILTAGDVTARVWDLQSDRALRVLRGHAGKVTSVAFSPDGRQVVTASLDGTASLWDARSGAQTHILHSDGEVNSAVYSPGGDRIVTASADATARVWDARTGKRVAVLGAHPSVPGGHRGAVTSAVFGVDGRTVVTTSVDSVVRIWDIGHAAEPRLVLQEHQGRVDRAAVSRDGRLVVSASVDGTARLWDARSGHRLPVLVGHTRDVNTAEFSRDGRWVATASDDGTARLWDARTGDNLAVLRGHGRGVLSAKFSPDGRRVLTAGMDGTARVWDPSDGASLFVLRGHDRPVTAAGFSPDGRLVVTASYDSTARVWDGETGEAAHILPGHSGVVGSVAFSPDGRWIATASGDGTARLWPVDWEVLLEAAAARVPAELRRARRRWGGVFTSRWTW